MLNLGSYAVGAAPMLCDCMWCWGMEEGSCTEFCPSIWLFRCDMDGSYGPGVVELLLGADPEEWVELCAVS
jgi:hypothetical protein